MKCKTKKYDPSGMDIRLYNIRKMLMKLIKYSEHNPKHLKMLNEILSDTPLPMELGNWIDFGQCKVCKDFKPYADFKRSPKYYDNNSYTDTCQECYDKRMIKEGMLKTMSNFLYKEFSKEELENVSDDILYNAIPEELIELRFKFHQILDRFGVSHMQQYL